MKTRAATAIIPVALLLVPALARGSDCSVSREFVIRHSQPLQGILQDPQGLALSGTRIELLSDKVLFRRLTTDNFGGYNFAEVPPGKYRVQVHSPVFCAPQVICKAAGCSFGAKLKLNSKNMVTVD